MNGFSLSGRKKLKGRKIRDAAPSKNLKGKQSPFPMEAEAAWGGSVDGGGSPMGRHLRLTDQVRVEGGSRNCSQKRL